MTNSELIEKLRIAQSLLSDVYHWASQKTEGKLSVNKEVEDLMSCADGCIIDALDALDWNDYEL